MLNVIGENSIASQFLLELRDQEIQKDRSRFRSNLHRLGEIMAFEISKKLSYREIQVQTPLGMAKGRVLANDVVLIVIMRAGLPYFSGFQQVYDGAECGFIGAYREENGQRISIQFDYLASPDLTGKDVLLIDPMLATGKSVIDAIDHLARRGTPRHIHLASIVASPEGIRHLTDHVKLPHTLWTFSVDERLDERFYIVPGLGDAGDLSFGPKL